MVTGQARVMQQKDPRRVVVIDRNGRPRTHTIWMNNPRIWNGEGGEPKPGFQQLENGPGMRPYIDDKTETKWTWKNFDPPVGEIYLSRFERQVAELFGPIGVVLEPNIKPKASPNKDWGRNRWARLAELLYRDGIEYVQLGPPTTETLKGARLIRTDSFRAACAVLARAKAAVLPEGGLHHAAAALNVKSVVIFGGFISPRQTGYRTQTNLFTGGEPCGMRAAMCDHCVRAMNQITPELVFAELKKLIA